MSNVLHPVVTEFERLLNSDEILMADFYADRCGPCRMLAPIIEEIADEYDGKVTVVKIDVDGDGRESLHISSEYQVYQQLCSLKTALNIQEK